MFCPTSRTAAGPPAKGWRRKMGGRSWTLATLLGSFALSPALLGQFAFTSLNSFGDPNEASQRPGAALIRGSDGRLYGTSIDGAGAVRGTVFRCNLAGGDFEVLHRFTGEDGDGAKIHCSVLEAADGALYATTAEGGISNLGTVFSLQRDGTGFRTLHDFTGTDGAQPQGGLVQRPDGTFLGTTRGGGDHQGGTVFRLNPDGGGFAVVHHFGATPSDGTGPCSGLVLGLDNAYYGTTYSNRGTIFRLSLDPLDYRVLHQFAGGPGDGGYPFADLAVAPDGTLFGSTFYEGSSGLGVLFRINPDGTGYRVLHHFNSLGANGSFPYGRLWVEAAGSLLGTASFGGSTAEAGVVFRIQADGTGYQVLRRFQGGTEDGAVLYAGLLHVPGSGFFGVSSSGGRVDEGTLYQLDAQGQNYQLLHHFTGMATDGSEPYAGPLSASNSFVYTTTFNGGTHNAGTVLRVEAHGSPNTLLHSFTGGTNDTAHPYAALIQGLDGRLYGTATSDGAAGYGAVFGLNPDGSGYQVVHAFGGPDGATPYGTLLQTPDTFLYGTTYSGGASNAGTLFRLRPDGTAFQLLHTFTGSGGDGAFPVAGVFQGSDGVLYGTTASGGTSNSGTVFRIQPAGDGYAVLHRFSDVPNDGATPYAGLAEGSDGALYGVTASGPQHPSGTVFRLNRDGSGYAVVHRFAGAPTDGAAPFGALINGPTGWLYGVTSAGGSADRGTVFQIDLAGPTLTVIHDFGSAGDTGASGYGSLARRPDGTFLGTTLAGGIGCGTLFQFAPSTSLATRQPGQLTLSGPSGFSYQLQSADALSSPSPWQDRATVTLTNGQAAYSDPTIDPGSPRFYRATLLP